MYVKRNKVQDINFLASARYQNFTYQVDDTGVVANANGRKIIPAGTVYKNNGKAIGLIFHDVDVTEGPQAVAVMVEGWVIEDRLPVQVSDVDKATMTGIHFKEDYEEKTISYVATTDTKYQAGTTYYSKSGDTYTALVAGTDYTVGDNISGTIYVVKE